MVIITIEGTEHKIDINLLEHEKGSIEEDLQKEAIKTGGVFISLYVKNLRKTIKFLESTENNPRVDKSLVNKLIEKYKAEIDNINKLHRIYKKLGGRSSYESY